MDHLEILTSIIWLKKQFDGGLVESVLIMQLQYLSSQWSKFVANYSILTAVMRNLVIHKKIDHTKPLVVSELYIPSLNLPSA